MWSRRAISALVRCSPSASSTSVSWAEIPSGATASIPSFSRLGRLLWETVLPGPGLAALGDPSVGWGGVTGQRGFDGDHFIGYLGLEMWHEDGTTRGRVAIDRDVGDRLVLAAARGRRSPWRTWSAGRRPPVRSCRR